MSGIIAGVVAGSAALVGAGISVWSKNKTANEQKSAASMQKLQSDMARIKADGEKKQADDKRKTLTDDYITSLDKSKEAYGNQLALARQMGSMGLQDETKRLMITGAERAASNEIAASETARGGVGAAARAGQTMKDAYMELGSQDAVARMRNKEMQMNAEGMYGQQMSALDAQIYNAQVGGYVDPMLENAYIGYGRSDKASDYANALYGASIQNKGDAWAEVGKGISQAGGAVGGAIGAGGGGG